jgi:hypothetical protein
MVCHSAIVGKSPGEAMTSAFILAKSSRSPLKKLQDRVVLAAGIGNDSRSPSPQGGGDQDQWPSPPGLGEAARERIERREGLNSPPPPKAGRVKNSTTARKLRDLLVIEACPLYPHLAQWRV